jgi:hypothetical protein
LHKSSILDKNLNIVPFGASGDIYISGAGVARGYRNRPHENKERFLADKFFEGNRMYYTGDRGRYNRDGFVCYLGRKDHQLKIRGYRIEAGEIEQRILKFKGVENCIVASWVDNTGEVGLVGYIEARQGETVSIPEIKNYLKEALPEYMVPVCYVVMDKFPLTINGKVDRKKLPSPSYADKIDCTELRKPENELEENLIKIWESALKLHPIGTNYNFFSIGGNSLLGTIILSQIKEVFHVDIPLKLLFEKPTICELSEEIALLQLEQVSSREMEKLLSELE